MTARLSGNLLEDEGTTPDAPARPFRREAGGAEDVERQTTIRKAIRCKGVGLHSGKPVTMRMSAAPAGTGIVFRRSDLGGLRAPARYDRVCDTALSTGLEGEGGARVRTVEHLMAALWGCGVDNLFVDLDGPEVPAMDGSSEPFVFLVSCAGLTRLDAPRQTVRVLRPVTARDGEAAISLLPDETTSIRMEILFDHPAVGRQAFDFTPINGAFRDEIARARTFAFERDVEAMRNAGLALGGSLDNAIVIGESGALNDGGLRYGDECVRHKLLDCLGDLYLAGAPIVARVEASRTGHALNNRVLRALFSDAANWRYETGGKAAKAAVA